MRKLLVAAGAVLALAAGTAAQAGIVLDPVGDYINPMNAPTAQPDLDVTSFQVIFDRSSQSFELAATFAGAVDTAKEGFYVIGVNTGTGPIAPFGPVGQPNVRFNQAMIIQKTGAGVVGPNAFTATIAGNRLSVDVPLSFFPSTGFRPDEYGFNIWPRIAVGGLAALSDFAPNNALLSAAPEPSTWAMMIAGFGFAGTALRRRRAAAAVSS